MTDDDIVARRKPGSGRTSRATFSGREARGPIIDQEGREIPPESLEQGFREFRVEFGQDFAKANPFGNLTREQRLARPEAIA